MAKGPRLTYVTALILQAIDAGFVYGFSIMDMEEDRLISSRWERQSIADREQRPPRKYYQLAAAGKTALESSRKRYPLLQRFELQRAEKSS